MLFLAFRRDHIAADSALKKGGEGRRERGGGGGRGRRRRERGEEEGEGGGGGRGGRRREKGGGRGKERGGRRERGEETEERKGIEQRERMVRRGKSSVIPYTSSHTDCFIPSVIHLFCSTATMVEGGLSRSLKASRRTKSIAMSYTFIHTTWEMDSQ